MDGRSTTSTPLSASLRRSTGTTIRTSLDLSLLVFPELNRIGRVRANANARLKRELFNDFLVVITAYDMFDSEPQVVGVSRTTSASAFRSAGHSSRAVLSRAVPSPILL